MNPLRQASSRQLSRSSKQSQTEQNQSRNFVTFSVESTRQRPGPWLFRSAFATRRRKDRVKTYQPRWRLQFSLRTLLAVTLAVALVASFTKLPLDLPLSTVVSFLVGAATSVTAYRICRSQETHTFLLEIWLVFLIATFALWLPSEVVGYASGVATGVLISWQWPVLLSLLLALFGVTQVKHYPLPDWHPQRRRR